MSKKKIIVTTIILLFILMLIPIPMKLKDGGSTEYKAILYNVTKVHRINTQSSTGYETGWKIKILGFQIYNKVNIDVKTINQDSDDNIEVYRNKYLKIEKYKYHNEPRYTKYYEAKNLEIFVIPSIKEIYFINSDKDISLKIKLDSSFQTHDDTINKLIENMKLVDENESQNIKIYENDLFNIMIKKDNNKLLVYVNDIGYKIKDYEESK